MTTIYVGYHEPLHLYPKPSGEKLLFAIRVRGRLWVEFADGDEYEAISEQVTYEKKAAKGRRG